MITFMDRFYIIKKHLFSIKNLIFMIIILILFLILFTSLTVADFSYTNKKEIINSDIGRTYILYTDSKKISDIQNINHIKYVYSNKYLFQVRLEVADFDKNEQKGIILLKPLLDSNELQILSGDKPHNKNEIVCSNLFYPYEYDKKLNNNLFYSSKDILSKNISVFSQNEEYYNEKMNFDIVGTFKNKYMEEANVCYATIETYDLIASKYMGYTESYDEEGNLVSKKPIEYRDYFMRIDDYKNTDYVLNILNENGINYENYFYSDNQFLKALFLIPLFIIIVSLIISFALVYSFVAKKLISKLKYYALLQSFGWNKKEIIILELLENLFILIVSFIVAFVIYYLTLNYLSFNSLAELTYNNYIIKCPILFIILVFILMNLFILIVEFSLIEKYLKKSIYLSFNS